MLESIYLGLVMLAGCLVCMLLGYRCRGIRIIPSGKKSPVLLPPSRMLFTFAEGRPAGFTIFQAATAAGLSEVVTEKLLNNMMRYGILNRSQNESGVLIYCLNTPEKAKPVQHQSKLFNGVLDGA